MVGRMIYGGKIKSLQSKTKNPDHNPGRNSYKFTNSLSIAPRGLRLTDKTSYDRSIAIARPLYVCVSHFTRRGLFWATTQVELKGWLH